MTVLPPTPVEPPPVIVDTTGYDPSVDRLTALYQAYPQAKADADAAEERLTAITDGIKAELAARVPEGSTRITLRGPAGQALSYARSVQRRFNSQKFRKHAPDVYEAFREPVEVWTLRAAKDGE